MRLLLMRHAQCHSNVEGRMLGAYDASEFIEQPTKFLEQPTATPSELTALGKSQAYALGQWLAHHAAAPTHLYSSPLQRANETWACVQQSCEAAAELNILRDRRLIEINQGIFSGLTWSEAQQKHPQLCNDLEQSADWLPIAGAESPQACRRRAHSMVSHWLTQHGHEDCIWVVSHGGFLSHLVSELLGCDRTWGCNISPTGLFEFELDLLRWSQVEENRFNTTLWKINHFNRTEHLDL